MLLLACIRVTADQKHVTFVTNANRFRRTRQGCGVVATGMTKDFAAVSTMVLQQTQLIRISDERIAKREGCRPNFLVIKSMKI